MKANGHTWRLLSPRRNVIRTVLRALARPQRVSVKLVAAITMQSESRSLNVVLNVGSPSIIRELGADWRDRRGLQCFFLTEFSAISRES